MGRLFGTDGIRGIANVDLKPGLAQALGRATVHALLPAGGAVLVGRDTRRSGDMLVAALVSGVTSMGADIHRLGVVPTPALAFLTGEGPFQAGIMVSASHNPADDNGLKVIGGDGMKLDDAQEEALDELIWRADEFVGPTNSRLGRDIDADAVLGHYLEHRAGLARRITSDLRIVVDCANGAGGAVAPELLAATGASVEVIFNAPDGSNINLGCGATAPDALARRVAEVGADVGFALDGDADRCVTVDERGRVVDGDQLLGMLALERLRRGALGGGTLVVSVLSNGGLATVVEAAGGRIVRTPVGDRYILDAMLVAGAGLGGEKSGHVIIAEHASTGDGVLTALEVLRVLADARQPLSELAAQVPLYPQQQRAVHVRHKDQWDADRQLSAAVRAAEAELAGHGRVLVRPSGTESALRIMVEGEDADRVSALADALAALALERLH
ncbi:MAG: phosphoglucosamine mutase [Candidatus Limnocylindrales bacterium]